MNSTLNIYLKTLPSWKLDTFLAALRSFPFAVFVASVDGGVKNGGAQKLSVMCWISRR
jgi:hypothetical protein